MLEVPSRQPPGTFLRSDPPVGTPVDLAADLWTGFEVRLDLGGTVAPHVLTRLGEHPAVHQAVPSPTGLVVRTGTRADVPAVVAACVAAGASVFGVDPRDPNLEDVYFALEARAMSQASVSSVPPP